MTLLRDVGIVVVNYNSADLVRRNLALCDFDPAVPVVVVDNSVDEHHRRALAELTEEMGWMRVDAGGNQGFGSGANSGIAVAVQSGCRAVLLLNPDAWILPDDFAALMATHQEHPSALITPIVRHPDGRVWFEGGLITRSGRAVHASTEFPDWLSAACLLVPIDSPPPRFWPGYFLYWEDVEFSCRWKREGQRLLVDRTANAFHDVGGTQSTSDPGKSEIYLRFNCRNRLLFAARNLSVASFVKWVILTPLYARRMMRVARDGPIRSARASLVGSASGACRGARTLASRGGAE